jgi:hypothetical protein
MFHVGGQTDGRTDRPDKAKRHFSQYLNAPKGLCVCFRYSYLYWSLHHLQPCEYSSEEGDSQAESSESGIFVTDRLQSFSVYSVYLLFVPK